MFSWFRSDRRRKAIQEDRKYIVARARRFLLSYLASDDLQKQEYRELVAGAAAACQPTLSNPDLKTTELSQSAAEMALRVVKTRERQIENSQGLPGLITDAYATVAIAYRRAAAAYVLDEEMQQIGTAAVHLLTIATSHMAHRSSESRLAAM